MNPSIESWARRKRKEPFFSEKDWQYLEYAAVLFFLTALIFFVSTVFHLTDIAHAGTLRYQDVHTERELNAYLQEHPYAVVTRI